MSISIVETPSTTLRYTESRAFIKAAPNPGSSDPMIGKLGYAQFKHTDQRWYFREEGEQDWRWVRFHQIAFVPMVGDKVLITGSSVPAEYRWEQYATYSDADLRDRVVKVTDLCFDLSEDAASGTCTITGEVKSRQKPDDTEQIKVFVSSPGLTIPWRFAESVLSPEESECRATRFHEFHHLSTNLYLADKEKANYQADFGLISEALVHEAQSRDWCEEYDSFVDDFNSKSKVAYIEPRSNDYEVEVELEFTLRIKHSVYTSARNADDAVDNVRDMDMGDIDFDLHRSLSNFDYDVVDEDIHNVGDATQC